MILKPKVYIRADGNSVMGLGHLIRCMALAHMLDGEFEITFCCKEIPKSIVNEIETKKWKLIFLKREEDMVHRLLKKDTVVLDGYHFEASHQKKVKNTGAFLVCIDDFCTGVFFADIVINHAPGLNQSCYKKEAFPKLLLGPDFALLRPVFLEAAQKKIVNNSTPHTLFICFGGSDPENFTEQSVRKVIETNIFHKINVVVGAGYQNLENLKMLTNNKETVVEIYSDISSTEVLALMQVSNWGIVPASGILFEALATGLNLISGRYMNNQQFIYNGFKALSAFIDAENFTNDSFQKALLEIPRWQRFVKNPIDGLSGRRLLDNFKMLVS